MLNFKEWLKKLDEVWFSKGKATSSVGKPGPRTTREPKASGVKKCGQGGGPGSCQS